MKTLAVWALAVVGSGVGVKAYVDHRQSQVDETLPAATEGIVVVRVPDGTIKIEGWGRDEIRVAGTVADPEYLEFTSDHSHADVTLLPELTAEEASDVDLMITVPVGSSVDVETDGASVDVSGIEGVVRLHSESGDLAVSGNPMGIVARSLSGDIDIDAEKAPGIVHSEEGKVRLRGGVRETMASGEFYRWSRERRDDRGTDQHDVDHDDLRHEMDHARRDSERESHLDEDIEQLGEHIGSIVGRVLQDIEVGGFLDVEELDGKLDVSLSADLEVDLEELESLFAELEHELGEGMMILGDELEHLGDDLRRGAERSSRSPR
jgi:hypothetical protein